MVENPVKINNRSDLQAKIVSTVLLGSVVPRELCKTPKCRRYYFFFSVKTRADTYISTTRCALGTYTLLHPWDVKNYLTGGRRRNEILLRQCTTVLG